jgi:asparagine synthase (glutamine-hydrolysing)
VCGSDRLYCVDFPGEIDNLSAAKLAAKGKEIVPITFTRDELMDSLGDVVYQLDTPATWTAVCQYFMNKKIAEDGNVVVLAGEGADELFGGYARYRVLHWLDRMCRDVHLTEYEPLIARTFGSEDYRTAILTNMLNRGGAKTRSHARSLVRHHADFDGSLVDRMMHIDFNTTMHVLLRMADRMAMAFSLENRAPFLDYRLMELSQKIPTRFKVDGHESKKVLRRVAERLGVDKRIVTEKTKRGLLVPPSWGDGPTYDRGWFASAMDKAWRRQCE